MKKALLSATVLGIIISSCSMIEDIIGGIDTTTPDGSDSTITNDTVVVSKSLQILSLKSSNGLFDLTGNGKIENFGITTNSGFNINSNSYVYAV